MTIRDGIVLLEFADLVGEDRLSKPAYDKAVRDCRITRIQKGGDGHPALIEYSSLPAKYKEMVRHHLKGDPEELAKAELVEKHLVAEPEDVAYLNDFKASNGLRLNDAKLAKLKEAAKVMALLANIDAIRNEATPEGVVAAFGMPVLAFKATILQYIKAHKIALPTSFGRLEARKRAYLQAKADGMPGASSLVHGAHGNNCAGKLSGPQASALQLLASRHQNFGLRTIADDYNCVATTQGWPTITANTVKNFLRNGANGRSAAFYAKGRGSYQDLYGIVNHRMRPTQPTYMWVTDGKTYELYYQAERFPNGKKRTAYHLRKTVVVVIDAITDYPVGYAIGDTETAELSLQAMANAITHMRELTGEYALPYQIQSDNFGGKELKAKYKQLARYYTPAAAYNARAKVIEPYFRRHDDQYVQRWGNYAGHNITSRKENQPNTDALERLRHQFPTEAGVIEQIHTNFQDERAAKQAEFMAALQGMEAGMLRVVGREEYLKLLGVEHQWENELTNEGLTPMLLGEKRIYNEFSEDFQQHNGVRFTTTYDPADLSSVLVTARDGSLRYVLNEVQRIPMAIMDHTAESREQLAATEAFKKTLSQGAIDKVMGDMEQVGQLAGMLLDDARTVTKQRALGLTPEQEAVTKGYFKEKGSHKAALNNANQARLNDDDIEQRAFDQL